MSVESAFANEFNVFYALFEANRAKGSHLASGSYSLLMCTGTAEGQHQENAVAGQHLHVPVVRTS